jgi:hypothetical protein
MSRRGSTGIGLPTGLPIGDYTPAPPVTATAEGLSVDFQGEDGRHHSFHISTLPLPGWHEALAAGWASRIGPSGQLRTKTSAMGSWATLSGFMRFIAQTMQAPAVPSQLRADHVDAYLRHREASVGPLVARRELRGLGRLVTPPPLGELIPAGALDRFGERNAGRLTPKSGYSDGEFSRIVSAARSDVAALRDRLDGTRALLDRFEQAPDELSPDECARAGQLSPLARTGVIQVQARGVTQSLAARGQLAGEVFVTRKDLAPLLTLLVAVTGWNVETIKELPHAHRMIEGLAVELGVVKRRRGAKHWYQTVTWEIGPSHRELHTPGGLYLLLSRLMAPARALVASTDFWVVWHNRSSPYNMDQGPRNPFANKLNPDLHLSHWTSGHGLLADSAEPGQTSAMPPTAGRQEAPPLRLDFNRLKTSVDVRRTRQLGGHLPSAARSNTVPVLFTNYLAGDQTTIDWAQSVVSEALVDVQQSAWDAHQEALTRSGRTSLRVLTSPGGEASQALIRDGLDAASADAATDGRLDTAWTACIDHEHHPITGRRCGRAFLECFHCSNSLVIGNHLPGLLGLLDALEARRRQMTEETWWRRYGPAWAAIHTDILPKFSEAELAEARSSKPADALLDIVEPGWEKP